MNILTSFLVTTSLLLVSMNTQAIVPQAPVVPVVEQKTVQVITAPLTIKEKVYLAAKKYNISADEMWNTMLCENKELDPKKQSGYYYKGVREESYGLTQINLPSHPTITYEQATDIDWSINWMAKEFSLGHQNIWTCYRTLYGSR